MSLVSSAALKSTIAVVVSAVLMLVPVIRIPIYAIVLMFPAWLLSHLGVPGLGHELNGFFVLSAAAWSGSAVLLWLITFYIFYARAKRRAAAYHGDL